MAEQPRFLLLSDVAEILNTSQAQVYALVRRGELRAMKMGGRGQWRVQASDLEDYIELQYQQSEQFIADHPFTGKDADDAPDEAADVTASGRAEA